MKIFGMTSFVPFKRKLITSTLIHGDYNQHAETQVCGISITFFFLAQSTEKQSKLLDFLK